MTEAVSQKWISGQGEMTLSYDRRWSICLLFAALLIVVGSVGGRSRLRTEAQVVATQPVAMQQAPPIPLELQTKPRDAGTQPDVIPKASPVPFEMLYSRSGSVYRNFRYAVSSNDELRAVSLAQSILDSDEDHFISKESGAAFSLKKLAFDYLESLPPASLRKYQQRWDLDAEVLLQAARESGTPADYLELLDSYYFTQSGFEAVDWLASRSLDLGRFRTAARFWNQDQAAGGNHVDPTSWSADASYLGFCA